MVKTEIQMSLVGLNSTFLEPFMSPTYFLFYLNLGTLEPLINIYACIEWELMFLFLPVPCTVLCLDFQEYSFSFL